MTPVEESVAHLRKAPLDEAAAEKAETPSVAKAL
jgi:hypothetical protein